MAYDRYDPLPSISYSLSEHSEPNERFVYDGSDVENIILAFRMSSLSVCNISKYVQCSLLQLDSTEEGIEMYLEM